MTTTAFQWVFDNAESIAINRRGVTAQTISRNSTVRTISRGGQIWRFDVKLPDGPRWTDIRPYIEGVDFADKYTTGTVKLNNPGYSNWLSKYQGDCVTENGFTGSWTQGNNSFALTGGPAIGSGSKFKPGDFVQLGSSGHVYSVVEAVSFLGTTVKLNRPILDETDSGDVYVGENCTWNLVCVEMPQWTIFARDQVSWSGAFTFYEVMV